MTTALNASKRSTPQHPCWHALPFHPHHRTFCIMFTYLSKYEELCMRSSHMEATSRHEEKTLNNPLTYTKKMAGFPRVSGGRILQQELCKENGFFWVFFCLLVLCPFRRQFTVVIQTSTGEIINLILTMHYKFITIRYFFYFFLVMILKNQKVVVAWVWKCLKVQFSVQQSKQVSRHPSPTLITSTVIFCFASMWLYLTSRIIHLFLASFFIFKLLKNNHKMTHIFH